MKIWYDIRVKRSKSVTVQLMNGKTELLQCERKVRRIISMRRTPKENINQSFINLIRKAHGLIENSDIEKHRHSQDQMGALFGNSREVAVTETTVGSMYAEWIRVDRPHSGKKIILYCHGGGYSTGSPLYARTLTTKLASQLSMDVFCFDYRLAPEHPYPAAVDDAQTAWDYLMLQGYGAKDIFVAGD